MAHVPHVDTIDLDSCSVWLWNMAPYFNRREQITSVWKQSTQVRCGWNWLKIVSNGRLLHYCHISVILPEGYLVNHLLKEYEWSCFHLIFCVLLLGLQIRVQSNHAMVLVLKFWQCCSILDMKTDVYYTLLHLILSFFLKSFSH